MGGVTDGDGAAGAGFAADFQNCHQCVVGCPGAAIGDAEAIDGDDFQNCHQWVAGETGGAGRVGGAATRTFGAGATFATGCAADAGLSALACGGGSTLASVT